MIATKSLLTNKSRFLALATGAISSLIGGLVIIGWHTKTLFLIQLQPTLVAMQYNTALCFLVSGIGLIFSTINRAKVGAILGSLVFLFTCSTLMQYLTNTDFGIDQLFVKAWEITLISHPGRMSPITAIAFMLYSPALVLLALPNIGRFRLPVISLLASISGAIGITVIFGNIAGITGVFGLTQLTSMAIQTAGCFMLLSLGILSVSWRTSIRSIANLPAWLPLATGSAGLIITLGLWLAVKANERHQIERILALDAGEVSEVITTQLKTRILGLSRMAKRWQARGSTPNHEWELDAKAYIADFQGFQAIEWVDSTSHVRWVVPLEGNESVLNLDLSFETNRKRGLLAAVAKREATVSRKIELAQGGKGFLVSVPIFRENELSGFIVGVFRTDEFFNYTLLKTNESLYSIAVLEEGAEIYRQNSDRTYQAHWTKEADVDLGDFVWRVQVWPAANFFESTSNFFSEAVLLIGLMVSGGLALSLRLGERIRIRAKLTEKLNQDLIQQIYQREKTELKLRESEQRFEAFMNQGPFSAFMKDENGNYVYMNKAMERRFNISVSELPNKTDNDWVSEDRAANYQAQDALVIATNQTLVFTDPLPTPDGVMHHWLTFKFRIQDPFDRKFVGAMVLDVTDKVKAEEMIRNSLREKEILLKEIHHRVKNNLQIISSLLNLQSRFIKDAEVLELCQESQYRVKSMALIHEKLYQSENLSQIDFGEYIDNLTSYLLRSYSASANMTHLEIQAETILLNIDTAIPCGLIVNELFTNALKHGKVEGRDSQVVIKVFSEGKNWVSLSVKDNGKGFPEDLDFRKTESLGLQLVTDLVRQLKGKIELERNQGTCFTVSFPLKF